MKLKLFFLSSILLSTGCTSMYLPQATGESDAAIAQRRAEIRAMEMQDYKDERRKRKDAIEDLGTMEMNRAKAINKAYENRSKQKIYIVH